MAERHEVTINKYDEISQTLKSHMQETTAILNTISNLRYYYQLSKRHAPETLFDLYLPEWFIITSKKAKTNHQFESSESNIANQLFLEGFADENGRIIYYRHFLPLSTLPRKTSRESPTF